MIHQIKKYLFFCFGLFFLGLGITGYLLPGLPGTIFLIIAASCFLRSNERMYRWVTQHRLFGKIIRNYMETGEMPIRAKIISIFCIWVFIGISMWVPQYGYLFKGTVLALGIIGSLYILSRKSPGSDTQKK